MGIINELPENIRECTSYKIIGKGEFSPLVAGKMVAAVGATFSGDAQYDTKTPNANFSKQAKGDQHSVGTA